jgi:hypothetical protein
MGWTCNLNVRDKIQDSEGRILLDKDKMENHDEHQNARCGSKTRAIPYNYEGPVYGNSYLKNTRMVYFLRSLLFEMRKYNIAIMSNSISEPLWSGICN